MKNLKIEMNRRNSIQPNFFLNQTSEAFTILLYTRKLIIAYLAMNKFMNNEHLNLYQI